jgi:hypothetical protein
MASAEHTDSGPARHVAAHRLAEATVRSALSLGLFGDALVGAGAPTWSSQVTPPGVPETVLALNENSQQIPASQPFHGVIGPEFHVKPVGEPNAADARQQEAQEIGALISQGHQENQTFNRVASIIRDSLGAQNISIYAAEALVGRLLERYAQKVLENLMDDAVDYAADKTSEAIESSAQQAVDEFSRVLSSWRTPEAVPAMHTLNVDFNSVLPPDAELAVSQLRNKLKLRSDNDPQTRLDARTLTAYQIPAPFAVRALRAYDPGNAEDVASYLRYRVAADSLNAFAPSVQIQALVRIVDTPIRSSAVGEPGVDGRNAGMPDYRFAHDSGLSIGYRALGLDAAMVSKQNVLDVVQLQNTGYQAAEQGVGDAVRKARELGCTWEEIALRCGLSPHDAQQRYGP